MLEDMVEYNSSIILQYIHHYYFHYHLHTHVHTKLLILIGITDINDV